jgi:hypothetical protein
MLRTIGGVVLGYVTMAVLVFGLLTLAYLGLGADRAFRPSSYEPSDTWIVTMFAIGLLAAIVGGMVCAAVGRSRTAVLALAVVVVLLGVLSAIPVLMGVQGESQARTGDVSNLDAMMKARTPAWVALANVAVGVAGVVLGGRLRRPSGDNVTT